MAIYLPKSDTLILEVAKTGSKWVRNAIKHSGIPWTEIGPLEEGGHGDLLVHGRDYRFIICFVRNPVFWYRSYWAYRMEKGWRTKFTLDALCADCLFRNFIRKAATLLPGLVSSFYERYAGTERNPIHYIGHQEQLSEHLINGLTLAGESFDSSRIRNLQAINTSVLKPEISPDLRNLIRISEFAAMNRFGYFEAADDPLSLLELFSRYPAHHDRLRRLALATDKQHWTRDDEKEAAGSSITNGRRHARILANFALYSQYVIGDMDLAETLYWRAHSSEPNHPRAAGSLARFLHTVKNDYGRAEKLYEHAIKCAPDHAENLGNFAVFLSTVRSDHSLAELYYRLALRANPKHEQNLINYAGFLANIRQAPADIAGDSIQRK